MKFNYPGMRCEHETIWIDLLLIIWNVIVNEILHGSLLTNRAAPHWTSVIFFFAGCKVSVGIKFYKYIFLFSLVCKTYM